MNVSRKVLSLSIAILLLLSFTACAGSESKNRPNDTSSENTAPDVTVEPDDAYEPLSLPDTYDFGGDKIRIIGAVGKDASENDSINYYVGEITVEELTNEAVNDAVYNRELFVEDLLNVDIEGFEIPKTYSNYESYILNMSMAGDDPGEIAAFPSFAGSGGEGGQIYRNLKELDIINIDAPWWFDGYTDAATVGDTLYAITGDLSLTLKRLLFITLYNKKLADDLGIEGVYDVVFDGKWTLDYMTELTSGIYRDLNGNSEADDEDMYGLIISETSVDPFWTAFDIEMFGRDENNYLTYTLDREKFGIAVDKVNALFAAKSTFDIGWSEDNIYKYFASDLALVGITRLCWVERETMRNMQSEYGIIPLPKFDEKQAEYYTMPSDTYTVFSIPTMTENVTAAQAVLEAMGWYSYRYVTPAYFDVAMKGKYANDLETRRMIDIVRNSFRVDMAWIASGKLYGIPQMWRFIVSGQEKSWTSALASKERKINILVQQLNKSFGME